MPDTVSSTTVASSADSAWIAITDGKSRPENRRASTFTSGRGPRASNASNGLMLNMITLAASTVAALETVIGIITTNAWTCCRSVFARLISCPVCTSSWNAKCSRCKWAKIRSRSAASHQRASRNGEPAPQPAADARQHAGEKDRERPAQEGALRVGLDASIDRQRHEGWHCHLADRGREPGHHAYGQTPPLPPKLGAYEVPARPAGRDGLRRDVFRRSAFHSVSARPNDS